MIKNYLKYKNPNFYIYSLIKCRNFSNQRKEINLSPLKYLQQKIQNGELIEDKHQFKLCKELNEVFLRINDYTPIQSTFISRIIGEKQNASPKGLYLYGAVGGGKTMLMDLFYDCVKVIMIYK